MKQLGVNQTDIIVPFGHQPAYCRQAQEIEDSTKSIFRVPACGRQGRRIS